MIPAVPRLDPRCHLIPDPPGVILRRGGTSLRVGDAHRSQRLISILELLDGRAAENAVCAAGLNSLSASVQILEELDAAGLLVEHGCEPHFSAAIVDVPPPGCLAGVPIEVEGGGAAARFLASELSRAGALRKDQDRCLRITCLDGPDLTSLEQINQSAWTDARPWMPAFPLGDDLIAGPVIEPGSAGCFRCLETRWLGLAQSVRSESACFRWLREGGWRLELASHANCEALARLAVQLASDWIARSAATGEVVFLNLVTGQLTRSRLLPHPRCEVCGKTEPKLGQAGLWAGWRGAEAGPAIADLSGRLTRVVDDRIGLVGRLAGVCLEAADAAGPPLVTRTLEFALPSVERLKNDSVSVSAGFQPDAELATLVAIAEGLERYCGLFPLTPDVVAPYRDVADQAILPTDLPLFSEAQYAQSGFPFQRFDGAQPLSWMWGYSLTHDIPKLVPKSAVTYGPTDDKLLDECSSGIAAATSVVGAALRALCERVERDAFMIFWLNRLAPPLLEVDRLPDGFSRSAMREIESAGYRPFAANITTDLGIPVFLALGVRTDGRFPALAVGAGCALNPIEALDRAFRETLSAVRWYRTNPSWRLKPPLAPEEVVSLEDHGRAYSHPGWLPRAEFLWSSTRRQQIADLKITRDCPESPGEQLAFAVDALRAHGLETIVVDLTTPDVAPTGIRIVRAIIPGLQPIVFGKRADHLGGQRVYLAPCRMGYRATPAEEADLNPDPHCFP